MGLDTGFEASDVRAVDRLHVAVRVLVRVCVCECVCVFQTVLIN